MKSYNVEKINPETFLVDALDFFEISGLFLAHYQHREVFFRSAQGLRNWDVRMSLTLLLSYSAQNFRSFYRRI